MSGFCVIFIGNLIVSSSKLILKDCKPVDLGKMFRQTKKNLIEETFCFELSSNWQ